MIQFTRHHIRWHIIGLGIIALATVLFVFKLIQDARQQPVKTTVVKIEK